MTDKAENLSHIDASGAAHMVDVGGKDITQRVAVASGSIVMQAQTLATIRAGDAKKGDVLGVARIAGIQAAKETSRLIPLCHPLALTKVAVEFELDDALPGVRVWATAKVEGKTGVEMEALTAASVALLTVYDMAKAVDKAMMIGEIKVEEKLGGKSGPYRAASS